MLLLGVEDKIVKIVKTIEIMIDIIEDSGEAKKKLSQTMENRIPNQDAKFVDEFVIHFVEYQRRSKTRV